MIITHETTIEEYEAWLAQNPKTGAFKKAVSSTFKMINKALNNIQKLLRKAKTRSCLSPKRVKTVYPDGYVHPNPADALQYRYWLAGISGALEATRQHIHQLTYFDRMKESRWAAKMTKQRKDLLAALDAEIRRESLKAEALEQGSADA